MRKILIILVSIVLLIVIVMLPVFITHRPHTIWHFMTSLYSVPDQAASSSGTFTTLPPGSALPSEQVCAARVHRSSWEPRADNERANHTVPTATQIRQLIPWGPSNGVDPRADILRKQITGKFTGTTDEILQWVACKWGIDINIVRAEAVAESFGIKVNEAMLHPTEVSAHQGNGMAIVATRATGFFRLNITTSRVPGQ